MPHTGVAFMFIVGVGLGAFLYYMFADNQRPYSNSGDGDYNEPPRELPGSWSTNQDENETRRRKRGSTCTSGKTSCTICLGEVADKVPSDQTVELLPCGHKFHKPCISKWRVQGPLETHNTCPNCREGIIGTNVWH